MQLRLPLASVEAVRAWSRATLVTNRGAYIRMIVLLSLSTAAGLAGPQILGVLVDSVAGDPSTTRIDLLALLFVTLLIAQAVLKRAARLRAGILGERVLAETRERFVGRALRLPLDTVEAAGTGDLLSRATSDVDRIQHAVRNALPEILVSSVTVLGTVVAMVVTSPLLAAGLLVAVPVVYFPSRWYWKRVPATIQDMLRRWADVQSATHETADGARTAEALGLTERRVATGSAGLHKAVGGERALRTLSTRWVPWLELSHALPIAVILLLGAWGYTQHWVSLGTITAMVVYAQALASPLDEVLWWTEDLQVAATALRRVLGVHADPAEPTDARPANETIDISGVRFGYPRGGEVLHGVDLRVPRGEHLAVVGPSGAGKSTLARLVAGIARPSAGSVTIGGVEVSALPDDVLRGEVLLLTQEQHVFAGTLRENLTLPARGGGGPFSDVELLHALDAVHARAWVRSLPDGLDTELGAGKLAVSAAVAQQLALARVVLADPHTLILDEATSLLDPGSARELESALSTVLAGRTVIAIAHRLHTAATADRVAVVEGGRIIELGTHADLLAAGGPYASLAKAAT